MGGCQGNIDAETNVVKTVHSNQCLKDHQCHQYHSTPGILSVSNRCWRRRCPRGSAACPTCTPGARAWRDTCLRCSTPSRPTWPRWGTCWSSVCQSTTAWRGPTSGPATSACRPTWLWWGPPGECFNTGFTIFKTRVITKCWQYFDDIFI